jgi:serine/threonine protein phosphatase PrpC
MAFPDAVARTEPLPADPPAGAPAIDTGQIRVADLISAAGYYTELLASTVGVKGPVIAWNNPPYAKFAEKGITERYAGGRLGNVRQLTTEVDALELPPASLDAALFVMSYHDAYWRPGDKSWDRTDPAELLRQLVVEAHLMIKLTAITSEEEPHSTVASYIIGAGLECDIVHAGDSRVYHFRGAEMMKRTVDHSYVQRLVDEGKINEEQANTHPQSNLLTGCLGTQTDPPVTLWHINKLEYGDSVLACSDGLWHYFTPKELGAILHALPPREASEMLISKARQRARGGGDNLSLALARIDALH